MCPPLDSDTACDSVGRLDAHLIAARVTERYMAVTSTQTSPDARRQPGRQAVSLSPTIVAVVASVAGSIRINLPALDGPSMISIKPEEFHVEEGAVSHFEAGIPLGAGPDPSLA